MCEFDRKKESFFKQESNVSVDDLIAYIIFKIQGPLEDYYWAIDFLKKIYSQKKDVRLAILGSYLFSTFLSTSENPFLPLLDEYLQIVDTQTKAIIYYLRAYDLYLKYDDNYPQQYFDDLRMSISYSERFVLNYVRLAEVSDRKEARFLLDKAIENVEKVWTEEQLQQESEESFLTYKEFVDEFILGVDISSFAYEDLVKKRKSV